MSIRPASTAAILLLAAASAPAAEPSAEQVRFFETSVRPLLAAHCFECHGEKKQWANLRLDSREAVLKGGDSGPAVSPGNPDESLLIRAVRRADPGLEMPPEDKLSQTQVATLTRWVKMGIPYPSTVAKSAGRSRDPNHWAFQPPRPQPVPNVRSAAWCRHPLDRFVLAKLEDQGVEPAPPADRRTLIRRVTFDLAGLPPTPDEIDDFLADDRPEAFARVVDRLLASPAYGERWGRHWLDVARYADSNGLDENVAHGNAWRYRDYVIESFNADRSFEQFAGEQLAGDLLAAELAPDDPGRNELLVATGFLALGPKVLAEVDEKKMEMDIVDEQIDTFGRAFLGLTLGCARCHDHKFDPIDTLDYYALAGIFKSTQVMEHFRKVARWHENPLVDEESRRRKAAHDERVATQKAAIQRLVEQANAAAKGSAGGPPPANLEALYPVETKAELKKLRDELAALEKSLPEAASAMGAKDGPATEVAVHIRGSHLKLGPVATRRTPPVLKGPPSPKFDPSGSGRRELAEWLVDPQNPLTRRVIVNRVWRWHLGRGLVASTDNFGLLGDQPTHPELLDWLAESAKRGVRSADLQEENVGPHSDAPDPNAPSAIRNWQSPGLSLKRLHRAIVLSATYQQASVPGARGAERDPDNRLFGRAAIRRLEAEETRDALLAVSGRLDRRLGGSLLSHVKNRGYLFDHTSKDLTDYRSDRRSLYLPIIRNNTYDVLQLLDFPDAAVSSGDRASTTVAPQALMMLNSELVAQAAADLAARLLTEASIDDLRIDRLYRLALGRPATPEESAEGRRLVDAVERAAPEGSAEQRRRLGWDALCQVILASNEFAYVR